MRAIAQSQHTKQTRWTHLVAYLYLPSSERSAVEFAPVVCLEDCRRSNEREYDEEHVRHNLDLLRHDRFEKGELAPVALVHEDVLEIAVRHALHVDQIHLPPRVESARDDGLAPSLGLLPACFHDADRTSVAEQLGSPLGYTPTVLLLHCVVESPRLSMALGGASVRAIMHCENFLEHIPAMQHLLVLVQRRKIAIFILPRSVDERLFAADDEHIVLLLPFIDAAPPVLLPQILQRRPLLERFRKCEYFAVQFLRNGICRVVPPLEMLRRLRGELSPVTGDGLFVHDKRGSCSAPLYGRPLPRCGHRCGIVCVFAKTIGAR